MLFIRNGLVLWLVANSYLVLLFVDDFGQTVFVKKKLKLEKNRVFMKMSEYFRVQQFCSKRDIPKTKYFLITPKLPNSLSK